MAGWTKADYDAAYSVRVERYLPGGVPKDRPEVNLNYHRWSITPVMVRRWQRIVPLLGITPSDNVCVVGAGFGWGVEQLVNISGCTAVGLDISDYIQAEKGNTEEAELRALVTSYGLDPDSGRGLEIMNFVYDGQPRANVIVLNEDMQTNQSRNRIRQALNNNWPNIIIFEDIVDDNTTDAEIVQASNAANLIAGNPAVYWLYTHAPGSIRSPDDIATLTGDIVIQL